MKAIIAVILSLSMFSGCANLYEVECTYAVTGTADMVTVTYCDETGSICQESEVSVPWEKSFITSVNTVQSITVQNCGRYGSFTAEIRCDGETVKKATGSGPFAVAECSVEM